MSLSVVYDVVEHAPDDSWAPEPFGTYLHPADASLRVGDVIQLRWLDGTYAHRVKIHLIRGGVLHVIAESTADNNVGGTKNEEEKRGTHG